MYVNLLLAAVAFFGGMALLQDQPKSGARMDIPGVLLASAGMFAVVLGFSNAHNGWGETSTWGFLAGAPSCWSPSRSGRHAPPTRCCRPGSSSAAPAAPPTSPCSWSASASSAS